MNIIYSLLFLVACAGVGEKDERAPTSPLLSKYVFYKANTFYMNIDNNCDALLFDSLVAVASDKPFNIEDFIDSNGAYHRTPAKDCFSSGRSKSTISRDMFIGVMWYIYKNKRLDLAESLYKYGKDHDWIMGEGPSSRTWMSFGLRKTLALLINKLGGHNVYFMLPDVWSVSSGYTAHLTILHLLLRQELGGLSSYEKYVINRIAIDNPLNPLFQYANGQTGKATELLLNEKWWPADRLPESKDRCSDWITQREYGKDYLPCPEEGIIFNGGDFLFTAWLILRVQ